MATSGDDGRALDEALRRLATAERHMEALLNTLGASSHPWIVKVYRNAKAAWENRHA